MKEFYYGDKTLFLLVITLLKSSHVTQSFLLQRGQRHRNHVPLVYHSGECSSKLSSFTALSLTHTRTSIDDFPKHGQLESEQKRALNTIVGHLLPGTRKSTRIQSQRTDNSGSDDEEPGPSSPRMRDRIRGWFRSKGSNEGGEDPPRVKADFGGLFSGMPGLNDIYSAGDEDFESEQASSPSSPIKAKGRGRSTENTSWFEDEKKSIIQSYESMLGEMMENIEAQRREDPELVPENAEAMIKSVLKQEMEAEIKETQRKRSRERLASYEVEQRAEVEAKDVTVPITNSNVRRLIDEGEAEYERQLAAQARLDEFLRYEAEAFSTATTESARERNIKQPEPNADLDLWALERLQDMALYQEELAGDDAVLEILEENLDDLRERMEKESAKGPLQPQTMKEWQMYRAIATRLGATVEAGGAVVPGPSQRDVTEEEVYRRLESWKDYTAKEVGARDQGGLSRGPKLPFEWQELGTPKNSQKPNDRLRRMETRKQINRMSIDALESLMKTADNVRREKLRKEIEYLKRELESKDYLDVEELEDADQGGPVDLRGVFPSSQSVTSATSATRPVAERRSATAPTTTKKPISSSASSASDMDTSAFQSNSQNPPTPKTAFFSDEPDMEVAAVDSKLGTMEDQKLEAMYRRAGARTRTEREKIKAGYEEFKRVEEEKRKVSGLEGGGESGLSSASTKYNVSEVMLEGGDFDANKILSAIGPRPTRTKKPAVPSGGVDSQSTIRKEEVVSSLYRSVAAAGGGRFKDDPEAKAKDEASFSEYLQMEQQMRDEVDATPADELLKLSPNPPSDLDDEQYADQVLSQLGPRPTPKKYERVDERYLSDTGGVFSQDDEEEDEEEDVDVFGIVDLPEWIKREQKPQPKSRRRFLSGEDIEEAFPDDQYEHNMRQLAEYERRRAGKTRSMGIDISDVLGSRKNMDSDDYKDYKFEDDINRGRRVGWGGATFETRKRDLMDYTELDVPLLNALMEQRDAVSATGVSRYLAKINKPFKEFGAIVRLEVVIADISGLQMKAWSKVSDVFKKRAPTPEEVKMAAVERPDLAISDVFGWTNDFVEVSEITSKFRELFGEVFEEWAVENNVNKKEEVSFPPFETAKGSLAIGEEVVAKQTRAEPGASMTETEILQLLTHTWARTADKFDFPRPSQNSVVAAASMGPELAVLETFRWTRDRRKVDEIVTFYRRTLDALKKGNQGPEIQLTKTSEQSRPNETIRRPLNQNDLMELHYRAWISVASKFGFTRPTSDEVLAAFVLNDPVLVVKNAFCWTEDIDEAIKIGQAFTDKLRSLADDPVRTVYGGVSQPGLNPVPKSSVAPVADSSSPLYNDILKFHRDAWTVCSHVHKLSAPSPDQVRLSVSVDPVEFIQRVMRWSTDPDVANSIATTFRNTMKDVSKSFVESSVLSTSLSPSTGSVRNTKDVKSGPSADDVFSAARDAWDAVARKFRLTGPTTDQILYAMSVGPEEAIQYGFRWATDEVKVGEILSMYMGEIEKSRGKWSTGSSVGEEETQEKTLPLVVINPGTGKWIQSLLDVEMECGIVSHLTRSQVNILMEYAGIADLIGTDKRVPASTGPILRPTVRHYFDSQQMLAAALRLERRPDFCVLIDGSPGSSIAARSVEMQSIAWIGSYPRYELLSADATVSRLDELTAMNIRRLFGERIYDQPLLDLLQVDPQKKKKTKTKYDWGDE